MNISKTFERARVRMTDEEVRVVDIFNENGFMPVLRKATGKYGIVGSTKLDRNSFMVALYDWLTYIKKSVSGGVAEKRFDQLLEQLNFLSTLQDIK